MNDNQMLKREAILFAEYFGLGELPDSILERYISANEKLFTGQSLSPSLSKAIRSRLLLSLLDAGLPLMNPQHLLRQKLIAFTAILEASPFYTDLFLPAKQGLVNVLFTLLMNSVFAGFKILAGIPVCWVLARK